MKMEKVKTAVVGFGMSGQTFHAPIIDSLNETELTAVLSSNKDRVLQHYPDVTVYNDYDKLLSDPTIELVVVTTPNQLHYSMAKQAIRANKHVVLEKPFVVNVAEGEHLVDLAKQHEVCLSVYHNRRFDGDFLTVKKLQKSNELGAIHTFESSFNRYRPDVKTRWKESDEAGSGVWYDLGSHLVDQALQLFGLPTSVYGSLRAQRTNAKAVDQFLVVLNYSNIDVILRGDCLSTDAGPRFIVKGDQGHFIKYGLDPQENALQQGFRPNSDWGNEPPEMYGVLTDSEGKSTSVATLSGNYPAYYQQLAQHIRGNTETPVSALDALNVIKVIQAVEESATSHKATFL
jgi:scyllo-inositol 2-dehydrogenase (NADP+)